MRSRVLLGSVTLCLLLLPAAASASSAEKTFRWRDAQGQVHYSNLLPRDAVDRGYEVLNSSGDVIKRVPPPLTPAQRAAAEAAAKRVEKQATLRAEQARRDNMLLRTFNSVHDIERLRANRVGALDAQLRLMRDHQDNLEKRLAELRAHEAKLVAAKHAIPADVRQEIDDLRSELVDAVDARQVMETERANTERRFQDDIARFKQLQAEGRVYR